MLIAVTADPKAGTGLDRTHQIYLLEGWVCFAYTNIEFYSTTDIRQVRITSNYDGSNTEEFFLTTWILHKETYYFPDNTFWLTTYTSSIS